MNLLSWTPDNPHEADEIRDGVRWHHVLTVGETRGDGRIPFELETTWGTGGRAVASGLTNPGQDVFDAASDYARAWGGRCR